MFISPWAPFMWLLMCSDNYFSSTQTQEGQILVAPCLNFTLGGQQVYCLGFPWWFTRPPGLKPQCTALKFSTPTKTFWMLTVGVLPHSAYQVIHFIFMLYLSVLLQFSLSCDISASTNTHLGALGELDRDNGEDGIFSNYYHFVPYISMMQGLMLALPALVWQFCEGGVTNQISSGCNGKIICK